MNLGDSHTGSSQLREVVDKHYAALVDELKGHLDSELQTAREEAREETSAKERLQATAEIEKTRLRTALETRLATAESLNQNLRRIRQAASSSEALSILLESSTSYARQAVVLQVENHQVHSLGVRGIESTDFSFPVSSAAAIAGICETHDPLVSLASDNELSPELALAFTARTPDHSGKAYLFPVVARQEVIAVLIVGGEPVPAALELLTEAVGMKIESLEQPAAVLRPLPGAELVQITATDVPETAGAQRLAWSDLSLEDQRLHLHAQRVARVKVAEMRLYHADALRKGVFVANIYGALTGEIDRARSEFLQTFLSKSPTMVDYLHLEILRSLAHEDERLLGHDYPGPMV